MKKIILILIGLFSFGFSFAYQQQGFNDYYEGDGYINFTCTSQCFLLVGAISENDYINIDGNLQGNGIISYGFLVGDQIYPGEYLEINGGGDVEQKFILSNSQFYSQVPGDSQLAIIFEGNLVGNQLGINGGIMGVVDKIGQFWNDFWKIENLTPYSINLRYGVFMLGKSIVKYGYIIFIIFAIYILFSRKYKNRRYNSIFYLGLSIFLFIGIRNLITYIDITNTGLRDYSFKSYENKSFFDLGDYIIFTDKIRKELNLDIEKNKNCSIFIDSFQDRPFKAHRESLYLKPCVSVITQSESDYILYYKKQISQENFNKQILVEFNGSYLLKNK